MRSLHRSLFALAILAAAATTIDDAHAADPAGAHHDRGTKGVFWFFHISDMHIGAAFYETTYAKQHLQLALGEATKIVSPKFVLASGDLQDGSGLGVPTSGQSDAQWNAYRTLYQEAGMTPDFYFDLPGNHDAYGDTGLTHYLSFSLQGATKKKLYYDWTVTTELGEYYFFALNSNGDSFKPLTNCCAKFTDDELAAFQDGLKAHEKARLAFVVAHHALTPPSGSGSSTPEKGDVVRGLLDANHAFYLHGDLHAYGEYLEPGAKVVVNQLSSLGKKDEDNLGVAVIDHDAFVYRATSTKKPWPFVVITAPVSRDLRDGEANPWAYSVCSARKDNPVRALVFGKSAPTDVVLKIGPVPAVSMKPAFGSYDPKRPIFEAEIDTTVLDKGTYDVAVTALVGGELASHSIRVTFTSGPCDPLPSDVPPPTPTPDAGADTDPPTPPADAGPHAETGVVLEAQTSEQSGCGCRTAPDPRGKTGLGWLVLPALLAALSSRLRRS